jgi:YD repeat-containing protein
LNTTWKLVEREFTGTSVTIPTGNVWIDELRLHPSESTMTTSTYEPLIGVTSMTDPTNRTRFYEYNNLGRLIRIRDQDGFIIEQYQYNFSN